MDKSQTLVSPSEEAGIVLAPKAAHHIYSVGISTGGAAEIRMARLRPGAHIVATTLDKNGAEFSKQVIERDNLSSRIEVKIEDVAGVLPYSQDSFDYVYARLILHYLTKQEIVRAVSELYKILRENGSLFVVVRSIDCPEAKGAGASYDAITGLTRYIAFDGKTCYRQFYTQATIQEVLRAAGFIIRSVRQYDEKLSADYKREQMVPHTDNVIEVIAEKQ